MLKIYGCSDDLIEIESSTDPREGDEVCRYDDPDGLRIVVGNADASPGNNAAGVIVIMRYASKRVDAGVWSAEIAPIDEDAPIPWPVICRAQGYSVVVEIDCPAGTPITWDGKGEDSEARP